MENPPVNNENNFEKMSEREIADYLLAKYPEQINSIETFDPDKIEIEGLTLTEIENNFKDKIKDDDEKTIFVICANFLHRPKIEDNFGNERQDRIDFINSNIKYVGDKFHEFFKSNRFKPSNILSMLNYLEYLGSQKNISDEIFVKVKEMNSGLKELPYPSMTQEQKRELIDNFSSICEDTVSYLIKKYKD